MEKLQKINSATSVLNMSLTEFLTEFVTTAMESDEARLTYNVFYNLIHAQKLESIEIENGDFNSLYEPSSTLSNKDYYEEYGLLVAFMESVDEFRSDEIKIRETFIEEFGDYKYTIRMLSNASGMEDGLRYVTFRFYTRCRISAFIEAEYEELEEQRQLYDAWHDTCEKPTLLLESKATLFLRACREIEEAIQTEYYTDISDFEYYNDAEIICNWMKYGNNRSRYNWIEDRCRPIVTQAVHEAFNWFTNGIKIGLIHPEITK